MNPTISGRCKVFPNCLSRVSEPGHFKRNFNNWGYFAKGPNSIITERSAQVYMVVKHHFKHRKQIAQPLHLCH